MNRLAVDLLHQRDELVLADCCNAIQHFIGVDVAGLDSLEIENAQSPKLKEAYRHLHVDNTIHGTGDDWNVSLDATKTPASVRHLGVHSATTGNQSDFVDSVGPANGLGASELNVHRDFG